MTFLPIVDRELRVAARSPSTYRNRALTAGAVAAVAVMLLLFASLTGSPSLIGGMTFSTLSCLSLGFCLLEGVRKTADCLSAEKREGTLGLLFLTDLKGYDVVFGKLAATSLNSFYGLVAILPVLALPMLLGGVTPGEYWRMVLALLNILFFSLCAGIWVSARCVQRQSAVNATFLVIVLISAIPLLSFIRVFFPFSPVYGFQQAFAGYYRGGNGGYWESLVITQLWSWLLLISASLTVPRTWRDNLATTLWRSKPRRRKYWSLGRVASREEMLATNPIYWLAAREQGPTQALNVCLGVALVGAMALVVLSGLSYRSDYVPVYFVCVVLLNFVLKMLLGTQAARFFSEARRENDLEMLLATPLRVDQFVGGQLLALERLFLAPLITIFSIEFAGAFIAILISSPQGSPRAGDVGRRNQRAVHRGRALCGHVHH